MTGFSGYTIAFLIFLLTSLIAPEVDDLRSDHRLTAGDRLAELDAFWGEMTRTVAEGEFEDYAALYHADAILVSGQTASSNPIAKSLDGWEQGFTDTKSGKLKADVKFVFSQRLGDETTAHETGMFHYTAISSSAEDADYYVYFEALLVKKGGSWKMMMEYQKSRGTIEDWDAVE